MTSADISVGNQPAHQFISFVEGSSSEAPDISAYPLQVLAADHNLNHLDGGDPTDGFSPWLTDILVYPSSEYWEAQLEGNKVRPYIDFSISNYNTLRIPSAVHNYNLYVDDARVYGDLIIDGNANLNGTVAVTGTIVPSAIAYANGAYSVSAAGDVVAGNIKGVSNLTLSNSDWSLVSSDFFSLFLQAMNDSVVNIIMANFLKFIFHKIKITLF